MQCTLASTSNMAESKQRRFFLTIEESSPAGDIDSLSPGPSRRLLWLLPRYTDTACWQQAAVQWPRKSQFWSQSAQLWFPSLPPLQTTTTSFLDKLPAASTKAGKRFQLIVVVTFELFSGTFPVCYAGWEAGTAQYSNPFKCTKPSKAKARYV